MGWTIIRKPYDTQAYLVDLWEKPKFDVLNVRKGGSTYYMAVRNNEKDVVFAAIILTSNHGNEFSYKIMTDACGPYSYDVTEKFLKLLSPTTNENALEWRAACWKRIENAKKKSKMYLDEGAWIRFNEPITFSNGAVLDTFQIEKYKGGYAFCPVSGTGLYQIKNWKERQFEIIPNPLMVGV